MEENGAEDFQQTLDVPLTFNAMNVELNEDPWQPLQSEKNSDIDSSFTVISRRRSDISNSHVSNGDVYESECVEVSDDGNEPNQILTYNRRFYILFVFSLTAFAQYCAWNAFGPISGTVKAVFGWGNAEIALLASLDPITYILTMVFFSWLMDVKGLRVSLVLSVFLMLAGTGLRCIIRNHDTAIWTMTTGQFLNGLAGPVTQAAPPLLSSAWFPRNERTTATAISALCGSLGVAMSFVIGPNVVGRVDILHNEPKPLPFSSSNHSFLSPSLNKTIPLSETLYKDAVNYWSMDELLKPMSNQTSIENMYLVNDGKSNKTGFAHGSILVPGQVGKAVALNGKGFVNLGDFANACSGNPYSCKQGFTVSFWLSYSSTNDIQYFLGTSGTDVRQPGFVIYHDAFRNVSHAVAVSVRTGKALWTTHMNVPSRTWTHVLFSWSARDGLTVYTNGTLASRTIYSSATDSLRNTHTSFTLGRPNNEYQFSWAAYDELAVWHLVFTENEAKTIYASSSGINFAEKINEDDVNNDRKRFLQKREDEIMMLLYIEFGVVAILFICTFCYFPDKPPSPPSLSSATQRENFKDGFRQLLRHKQFWTLSMIYGITTGVYSGWSAVLALNLEGFGIDQNEAGWIGFWTTIAGIFAGVLLARFSDFFGGRIKSLLLFLFVCSSVAFLLFSLLCLEIIPFSKGLMFSSSIIGGFSISGTIPLFYELTVECTYPIAEGVTTGILTLINNLFTVIFLVVTMIPGIGTIWMNWTLCASCAGCIPILCVFQEQYGRLVVDTGIATTNLNNDEPQDDNFKSIARVDKFMNEFYKSKESKL